MRRTVAPAEMPVTLAQVKDHLRVMHSDHDGMIDSMIMGGTEYLDGWTGILGRCLVTQTWEQDRVEGAAFVPPFPDMGEVSEATADGITTATFTAGYGGAADVPQPIRNAICVWVEAQYYGQDLPEAFDRMLAPYRAVRP